MKSKGIVLLCNTDNTIKSVLYNDLEIGNEILEGSDLIALFIETDIVKVKRFIKEIIREGAQFNWELNVILKNEVKTLVFDGALFDGVILLVGGIDNMNFELLSHELLKINNDQVNNVRSMAKQIADHSKQQEMLQKKSLDEMSLLNNELSNLQRQVMKQKIELERLNELKNQFLGIAAHDLRNPLGNIINLTEFLQDDIQDFSQDQAEFIGHIRDLSSYMLNLVNELLDYSAIEAGNITLNLEPTDFIELINKTLQYNKGVADKKDITITFTNKHKSIIIPIDV
ncbi:MAG: HAMP domain-containing histidine kinase, partial [Candidatus Cloacimonetes bacterium]|nr:HAMP domain-containing histidine kinase [Candidatus Cloacimonadota bacterium]